MKIGDNVKYFVNNKECFGTIVWLRESSAIILDENNNKVEIDFSNITVI